MASAVSLLAVGLAFSLASFGGTLHLPLLILASSVMASAFWGKGPGVLSAISGALALDWFFVPPYRSFRLSTPDLGSLFLLVLIALSIGRLADRLRAEAARAREGERRAQAISKLSRELTGAVTREQVLALAGSGVALALGMEVEIHAEGLVEAPAGAVAFPLQAPRKRRGTLVVPRPVLSASQRELAETLASLVGLALERVHFVDVAREALVRIEGERLRNGILSTLSHDLRTPLTGILAGTESLASRLGPDPDPDQVGTVREVAAEARRMADLVENLLELSRLQSGGVNLRCDWNSPVELVASALRHRERALAGREVVLDVTEDLPLVWCDGILVERVLVNLLDNASRHTPAGTPLRLWSESVDGALRLGLDDRGPGFDPSAARGGIGISLCRTIARAHGGTFEVGSAPGGGARVALSLPQDRRAPDPPEEEAA